MRLKLIEAVALAVAAAFGRAWAASHHAENVVVVTLDGFRWQDLFAGADDALMTTDVGGVREPADLKRRFARDTPAGRRETLMPFLWGTVAKKGQVFGNPARKAACLSTNGLKFSYPGYSELFCGVADPRIDSNAKRDNPNLSVLEFLNAKPAFAGKVEVVGTWDVFPSIFRTRQNGLRIHAGWEPIADDGLTERERTSNDLMEQLPRYWKDNAYDGFAFAAARSALERRTPRVLYVALGETDEWGHGKRYDLYLDAAQKADRWLAATWAWLQAQPQYRDTTALLVTTDHGRGATRDWTDHGQKVPGAEFIWIAAMGPGVAARGERAGVETTQAQVAATVAALVGEDFRAAVHAAAAALLVAE